MLGGKSQKNNKTYLHDLFQNIIVMQYYSIWSHCVKIALLIADLRNLLYGSLTDRRANRLSL
jgi:hypothetical protein